MKRNHDEPATRAAGLRARAAALLGLALAAGCVSAPPAPEREVTVLVYNIHAGKDTARRDNLPRVAELVRSTGADLVCAQHGQWSGGESPPGTWS